MTASGSSAPLMRPSSPRRPGRVKELRGIIFQSDKRSVVSSWFIRPIEMLDRRLVGLGRSPRNPSLAMHVGLHVVIEDGSEFVVEQLFGTLREDLTDGLNWTPLETFRARDRGGWDVTVPATAFRQIDEAAVNQAMAYLNTIPERPFFDEDCTMLVERAFGKRRMFADSPTARLLGFGLCIGDPALPLLRSEARLNEQAEFLLRAETLRALPDPLSDRSAPNARFIAHRMLYLLVLIAGVAGLTFYWRKRLHETLKKHWVRSD